MLTVFVVRHLGGPWMMKLVVAVLPGLLFAVGLIVSVMSNPAMLAYKYLVEQEQS